MVIAVCVLAASVTLLCALLLLRRYARTGHRLLLWSGLCFVGLTVANAVLVFDIATANGTLYDMRLWMTAGAMTLLMYGLIWDSK
jgi:hypothetical protein